MCIGARNRRLFLAYLGAAVALLAWTLAAAAGGAAHSLGRLEGGSVLGADPMLLAAALTSAALLLPVSVLLCYQACPPLRESARHGCKGVQERVVCSLRNSMLDTGPVLLGTKRASAALLFSALLCTVIRNVNTGLA